MGDMLGLRAVATAAALALSLLFALAAVAPSPVHADANDEARVYFERGNRQLARALGLHGHARQAGLEDALESFVSCMRIVRSRNAVYNAAVTLQELGRNAEAFTYFTEYLAMPGLSDAERHDVESKRNALRAKVAVVAVTSTPPGAAVRVDRPDLAPRGTTPIEVAMPAGHHTIFLSHAGYHDGRTSVNAALGTRVESHVTLRATPVELRISAPAHGHLSVDGHPVAAGTAVHVAPGTHVVRLEMPGREPVEQSVDVPPGSEPVSVSITADSAASLPGTLHVRSNVPAQVFVDGVPAGEGTDVHASLHAGEPVVRVTAHGRTPVERHVTIAAGGTVEMQADLVPSTAGQKSLGTAPLWMGVASGLVGAAAIVFSLRALKLHDDYETHNGNGLATQDERDGVIGANHLADGFWIGTAALGITAIILLLVNHDVPPRPSHLTVAAAPLRGGGMLAASVATGGL